MLSSLVALASLSWMLAPPAATPPRQLSVHRYLDPRNGRWTQRDPLGDVDGQNRYQYVRNSPVLRVDRSGKYSTVFPEQFSVQFVPVLTPTMGFSTFQTICMTGQAATDVVDEAMRLAYQRFIFSEKAQRFFTEIEPDPEIYSRFLQGTLPVVTFINEPLQVTAVNGITDTRTGLISISPVVLKAADESGARGVDLLSRTLVHELGHWIRVILNRQPTREGAGGHNDPSGRGEGWEAVEAVFGF